jgi:dTDP-4-dehydrorhamnose 3,5-epimerase
MISGVKITQLGQFHDERGKVMRMLRASDSAFTKFGEIYFSTVYPGVVKGWHKHLRMTINYACILGSIKVVLFDSRPRSTTFGVVSEFFLSPENYLLLSVPPGIWNGFKGLGVPTSIVANCADIEHSSDEIERIAFDSDEIPYDWRVVHR